MACTRCGGFLVIEDWDCLVDNVSEKRLRKMRCVNCGSVDDFVMHENRLIERNSLCCTTH